MKNLKTAVIGLGSMGYGIAQSILKAGHIVYGFDTHAESQQRFSDEAGTSAKRETVADSLDGVVVSVLNAAQSEAVL